MAWYAVRCIFEVQTAVYEERITIWSCDRIDDAIALAEEEAQEYVELVGINGYAGLAQAYTIGDDRPESGDEVFSLMRNSVLTPNQYISRFFDTGDERQETES